MPTSPSRVSRSHSPFELFASSAPGLESITAGELKTLGLRGRREAGGERRETGGVSFAGDLEAIYRANLWLRTASRVLVRLGQFHASTFYELERRSKKMPWAEFLPVKGTVAVRVTCRKSRLYHSDAVAERILGAIARVAPPGVDLQIGAALQEEAIDEADARELGNTASNVGPSNASQIFVVRIVDDQCEISADSSGQLLHRRGYRREIAKAPLRETLAAAMVLASGWQKGQRLLDPMCGSGTIPIEAALIARRIAPGLERSFQFMSWPGFDRARWTETVARAREAVHGSPVRTPVDICGADRDAGAVEAASRNAERAGVAADIQFSTNSVSGSFAALEDVADGEGWIITNPPYGIRVGEGADLRNLYATLGAAVKNRRGWRIGILAEDDSLSRQLGLLVRSRFDTSNGGIPVQYLVSERTGSGKGEAVSGNPSSLRQTDVR